MSDEKLITLIAEIWVENGGDAEGLDWCHTRIKKKIKEISKLKQ
jgi:hypothetical protein